MKKSFKRAAAAVLALTVMCGSAPVMPGSQSLFRTSLTAHATEIDSGTCGDNLTWVLDDEGVLTIEGTGEMTSSPWRDDFAENFYKVVLPDGLTSICDLAFFDCANLSDIIIPDSVTSIGTDAFIGTELLEKNEDSNPLVIVNNMVISIENCEGKVVIPEGIEKTFSLANNENITDIVFPASCKEVGYNILQNCPNLKTVTFLNPNIELKAVINEFLPGDYPEGLIEKWAITNNKREIESAMVFIDGFPAVGVQLKNKPEFSGTIYGYKGSTAEKFAKDYCKFETIKESSGKVQRSALRIDKGLNVDLFVDLGDDVAAAYIEGEDGVITITDFSDKKVTEGENAGLYKLSYVTKPEHAGSPITLRLADKDGNDLPLASTDSDVKTGTNSASITVDDYVKTHYSAEDAKVPWLGDPMCDNVFSADDASYALRLFTKVSGGSATATAFEMSACDVNADNKLTADDASLILRYYTKVSSGQMIDKYEYFKNPT